MRLLKIDFRSDEELLSIPPAASALGFARGVKSVFSLARLAGFGFCVPPRSCDSDCGCVVASACGGGCASAPLCLSLVPVASCDGLRLRLLRAELELSTLLVSFGRDRAGEALRLCAEPFGVTGVQTLGCAVRLWEMSSYRVSKCAPQRTQSSPLRWTPSRGVLVRERGVLGVAGDNGENSGFALVDRGDAVELSRFSSAEDRMLDVMTVSPERNLPRKRSFAL